MSFWIGEVQGGVTLCSRCYQVGYKANNKQQIPRLPRYEFTVLEEEEAMCRFPCTPAAKCGSSVQPILINQPGVPSGVVEDPFGFVSVAPGGPAQPFDSFSGICAARRSDQHKVTLDTEGADALFGDFSEDEQNLRNNETEDVLVESASGSERCAQYMPKR